MDTDKLLKAIQILVEAEVKKQLPKNHYLQLVTENIQCRQQQNIEALIQLQQKIACLMYS